MKEKFKWSQYCLENSLKWIREATEEVGLGTSQPRWNLICWPLIVLPQAPRTSAQCSRHSRYLVDPYPKIGCDSQSLKDKYFLSCSHNSCQTTLITLWICFNKPLTLSLPQNTFSVLPKSVSPKFQFLRP